MMFLRHPARKHVSVISVSAVPARRQRERRAIKLCQPAPCCSKQTYQLLDYKESNSVSRGTLSLTAEVKKMDWFRRKPVDFTASDDKGKGLKKTLGLFDLTALGLGAIVGTGIFVLTGIAAARYAGPGIVLSFIIAGAAAILAALVYAEMAAAVPLAGSAYTYAYVTLGEVWGWLVGWNLILEYVVAAGAVSAGWSAYLTTLLTSAGIGIPRPFTASPTEGGIINLPAVLITLFMAFLLVRGARKGSLVNQIVVLIKLSVILAFIIIGAGRINPANWQPFFPYGIWGAVKGAAIIFFAYIGFDAVSTAAEDVRDPQRSLPRGILSSLGISTLLYILVAIVLTGLVSYPRLDTPAPVAAALLSVGFRWGSLLVSVGALAGLASVLFATIFAQSRIFFAMARDGLIPSGLSGLHPVYGSPYRVILIIAAAVSLIGGFLPVSVMAELANIGTLSAFFATSLGVLRLEKIIEPDRLRFRVPFSPYLPMLSALVSLYLALNLPPLTWVRFLVWGLIGLLIYRAYGYRHSNLSQGAGYRGLLPAPAYKRRLGPED